MTSVGWWKQACEYLGGERDEPPDRFALSLRSPLWGIWWSALAAVIYIFCGQASKFIYIDF